MTTKEKIKIAIAKAEENLINDRKLRDEALANFKKRGEEESQPIRILIAQYLDEELKDSNNNTVREGYVISKKNGYPAYLVVERGMQFIFGEPMFNPSLQVVTYSPSKNPPEGKKIKKIYKRELSEMQIVIDTNI